jgi:hypothetical protein
MKDIEVDDEVFAAIQAEAEPLVDDANSALRRLLGIGGGEADPKPRRKPGVTGAPRAPLGSLLPEEAYRRPVLLELLERGGTGSAKEITDAVGERVGDQLTEKDKEQLTSGDIRWRARVQFTRLRMKEDGLIAADSPRGVWVLTNAGQREAKGQSD